MSNYRNRFKIDDVVKSVKKYSYFAEGTIVRVVGVTETGSIKLDGIPGTYDPDNFILWVEPETKSGETAASNTDEPPRYFMNEVYYPGMKAINRRGDQVEILLGNYRDTATYIRNDGQRVFLWADSGVTNRSSSSMDDIVRIVPKEADLPIRTVVTYEHVLVPGEYGRVRITSGGYVRVNSMRSRQEVEDSIAILQSILPGMAE